jgi:hypothetical protein
MARVPTNAEFSQFFGRHDEAEQKQRDEQDETRRHATREALAQAGPVLEFVTALPMAVMASQRAELERLTAIDKQHPRAAQVGEMLDRLTRTAPMASRVMSRVVRGVDVARSPQPGLYGFVADAEGAPFEGAVVRLGEGKAAPSAKTAADGYFMVPLSRGGRTPGNDNTNPNTPGVSSSDPNTVRVRVEAADGQLLYEDPRPVNTLIGYDYREYIVQIPEEKPAEPKTPPTPPRGRKTAKG